MKALVAFLHLISHVTVNANGTATAEVDNGTTSCQ
jgi:hypothetical protein